MNSTKTPTRENKKQKKQSPKTIWRNFLSRNEWIRVSPQNWHHQQHLQASRQESNICVPQWWRSISEMVCKEPVPPLNLTHCNNNNKASRAQTWWVMKHTVLWPERKEGRKEKVGGPGIILLAWIIIILFTFCFVILFSIVFIVVVSFFILIFIILQIEILFSN